MKNLIHILIVLTLAVAFGLIKAHGQAIQSAEYQPVSMLTADQEAPGFGGKKAQNKRNRRTKRINRRNGLGHLSSPALLDWTLINVQLPKPLLAFELRKEISHE